MQKVIAHPTVQSTRTDLELRADGSRELSLHVNTRLVLTPDAPFYSHEAVSDFIRIVEEFRVQHGISTVVLHEFDDGLDA